LGLYVATANLDLRIDDDRTVLLHNAPGRLAAVHPATGQGGVAFIFRHPEIGNLDRCDRARQHLILDAAYAGMGWRVPELLELTRNADDMYFDSVSRIRLARWSTGRITVVGDAATCVSLLGDGSSLAIAGGATLANAVHAHRENPPAALGAYEQQHRRQVARRQRLIGVAAHLLVPATATGIFARNAALRGTQLVGGKTRRLRPDHGSTTRHGGTRPSP
jgi:2-polyprenyl-6-methoxyphenol hydroxylase-like FAD-dependent oxidoreductase